MLGETNVPELGGDIDCENPVFGVTSNPWDLGRTPGGSSGWEGAAVGARLCPLGIGSDTGASIRLPSHFNGVFGFKPGWGTVSRVGHLPPHTGESPTYQAVCVIGPIARHVEDLVLAYNVMRGPSWDSPNTVPSPAAVVDVAALRGLPVAWLTGVDGAVPIGADGRAAVRRAALALEAAGLVVDEEVPGPLADAMTAFAGFYDADGGRLNLDWYGDDLVHARPRLVAILRSHAAAESSAAEYFLASMRRDRIRSSFARYMEHHRIVVTPVYPTTAYRHGQDEIEVDGTRYDRMRGVWPTLWVSTLGLPAAVVPAGLDRHGPPLGVQVVGRAFDEATVLSVAQVLEDALGGCREPGWSVAGTQPRPG